MCSSDNTVQKGRASNKADSKECKAMEFAYKYLQKRRGCFENEQCDWRAVQNSCVNGKAKNTVLNALTLLIIDLED